MVLIVVLCTYATSALYMKRSTSVIARFLERLIESMPAAGEERKVATYCFRFGRSAHKTLGSSLG